MRAYTGPSRTYELRGVNRRRLPWWRREARFIALALAWVCTFILFVQVF